MKIAYPLKQDATDPRVVLDANLSVICTFLEGEHAEEMVETMNNNLEINQKTEDLFAAEAILEDAREAIRGVEDVLDEVKAAVMSVKDVIDGYSYSHRETA
jgi:NifU-like protein involved in Fe-S cluster formation